VTDVLELINEVRGAGVILRADPPDLIIRPAGLVRPRLKAQLKERKAEVLQLLELEASMKRLEQAGVCIAIWDDGSMHVVITERETRVAIEGGATVYSPQDMFVYVQLLPHERSMLHEFKKKFGGATEWRIRP
jgi:hypothetical protein